MREMVAPEDAPATGAEGNGSFRERQRMKTVDLGPDHAVRASPAGDHERTNDQWGARVGPQEDLHENERHERRRYRGNELGHGFGQESSGSPPDPDRCDEHSGDDARYTGEDDDQERRARAR